MKIKFMYENNGLLIIFLRLNGIAKIENAKIKMLRFGAQIAKIPTAENTRYTVIFPMSLNVKFSKPVLHRTHGVPIKAKCY